MISIVRRPSSPDHLGCIVIFFLLFFLMYKHCFPFRLSFDQVLLRRLPCHVCFKGS